MKAKPASSIALLALAAAGLAAQAPQGPASLQGPSAAPKRQLSQAFLDRMAAELPAVVKEIGEIGEDFQAEAGGGGQDPSAFSPAAMAQAMAAMKANKRVEAVLAKHGLKPDFWEGYAAAAWAYYVVLMDEAAAQSGQAALKGMADQARAYVHADDVALVNRNRERLERLFEEIGNR